MTGDPRRELPPAIAAMTVFELARYGRRQAKVARRRSRMVARTSALDVGRRERLSQAYLQAYCDAALCERLVDRVKEEEKLRRWRGGLEPGMRLTAGDVCSQEDLDAMLAEIGEKLDEAVPDAAA